MQSLGFFRCRIDSMADLRDPLAMLAQRLPWWQIEEASRVRQFGPPE